MVIYGEFDGDLFGNFVGLYDCMGVYWDLWWFNSDLNVFRFDFNGF